MGAEQRPAAGAAGAGRKWLLQRARPGLTVQPRELHQERGVLSSRSLGNTNALGLKEVSRPPFCTHPAAERRLGLSSGR